MYEPSSSASPSPGAYTSELERGNNSSPMGVVNENYKIVIDKILTSFRNDTEQESFTFPANLSSKEREYIHKKAKEYGFKSKSSGNGANRVLTISRVSIMNIDSKGAKDSGVNGLLQHLGYPAFNFPIQAQASSAEVANAVSPKTILDSYFNLHPINQQEMIDIEGNYSNTVHSSSGKTNSDTTSSSLSKGRQRKRKPHINIESFINKHESDIKSIGSAPAIKESRKALPVFQFRDDIVRAVNSHDVTVISGETGCGKSTQIPQYLLDDAKNPARYMICSEPRRLSAISLAERVAEERSEKVGGNIGYAVRFDSKSNDSTRLLFCTTGIALRSLAQANSTHLIRCSHIILDEVHERDMDNDFLLIFLRELLVWQKNHIKNGTPMKLVLMSATLHVDTLRRYFESKDLTVSSFHIPGTLFPVRQLFLYDILVETKYVQDMKSAEASELLNVEDKIDNSKTAMAIQNENVIDCPVCSKPINADEFGEHIIFCSSEDVSDAPIAKSTTPPASSTSASLASTIPSFLMNSYNIIDIPKSAREEMESVRLITPEELEEDTPPEVSASQQVLEAYNYYRTMQAESAGNTQDIDFDLIIAILVHIENISNSEHFTHTKFLNNSHEYEKSILIFLPSWADISELIDRLNSHEMFGDAKRHWILPLHSGVPLHEQQKVFKHPPPGVRKIIVSTNIAETSLTIPDVVYVIDSGLHKEKMYDPSSRVTSLSPTFVSQSSVMQRRGRAGRCQPGVSFHLFTNERFYSMAKFTVPEIQRVSLEELCLQARVLIESIEGTGIIKDGMRIHEFFSLALDSPAPQSVKNAVESLIGMNAIAEDEYLTELGWKLAKIPTEPRLAKMIFVGAYLGCLTPSVILGVAAGYRDPFVLPLNPKDRFESKRTKTQYSQQGLGMKPVERYPDNIDHAWIGSDHAAIIRPLVQFSSILKNQGMQAAQQFCSKNYLSLQILLTLKDMESQVKDAVLSCIKSNYDNDKTDLATASSSLSSRGALDNSSTCSKLVKCLLCISTFPNISLLRPNTKHPIIGAHAIRCQFSSSLQPSFRKISKSTSHLWFAFDELTRNSFNAWEMKTVTPVDSLCLILFGGYMSRSTPGSIQTGDCVNITPIDDNFAVIHVSAWIKIVAEQDTALKLLVLRKRFEEGFHVWISSNPGNYSDDYLEMLNGARSTLIKLVKADDGNIYKSDSSSTEKDKSYPPRTLTTSPIREKFNPNIKGKLVESALASNSQEKGKKSFSATATTNSTSVKSSATPATGSESANKQDSLSKNSKIPQAKKMEKPNRSQTPSKVESTPSPLPIPLVLPSSASSTPTSSMSPAPTSTTNSTSNGNKKPTKIIQSGSSTAKKMPKMNKVQNLDFPQPPASPLTLPSKPE